MSSKTYSVALLPEDDQTECNNKKNHITRQGFRQRETVIQVLGAWYIIIEYIQM